MKDMSPEEWERIQAEMKERIDRSLRTNPGYGDHLAEQFEAFMRENADLVIPADQTDSVPEEFWAELRRRMERKERKERWKKRAIRWAMFLFFLLWMVGSICGIYWFGRLLTNMK